LAAEGDPAALLAALRDAARANDLSALAMWLRAALSGAASPDLAATAHAWTIDWHARLGDPAALALIAANPLTEPTADAQRLALLLGAALGLCPPCALIPSGRFFMGASPGDPLAEPFERPRHEVELTKPFFAATTPVTQAQWAAVMGDAPPFQNPSGFPGDDRRPVERVLWLEANHYCMRLGSLLGFPPVPRPPADDPSAPWHTRLLAPNPTDSLGPRLPTEAEWEYAARAGCDAPLYAGRITIPSDHLDPDLSLIAWYRENALGTTHPVAQKQPNAWGLYDTLGNVDEWCWDWEDGAYIHSFLRKLLRDPTGPDQPPYRQARRIRGGSWYDIAPHCRVSYRRAYPPASRNQSIGFRFVVSASPTPHP
jgi:formylglycine-generating enzyme required for sulfatase activity